MTMVALKRSAYAVGALWVLSSPSSLHAQIGVGTWVQQAGSSAAALTMTVEACCNGGRRFIYRISGQSDVLMTIESPMDGTEVPVLVAGKPSGETMAIKRLDERHVMTVVKMNGATFGTSKATLSADGKTLTVENEITSAAGGQAVGKRSEVWLRK